MLARVLQKLTRITKATSQNNPLGCDEELADIGAEGRGVIQEMMQYDIGPTCRSSVASRSSRGAGNIPMLVSTSSCTSQQVDSWDIDVLSMNEDDLVHLVMHVFFNTELGQQSAATCQLKQETFAAFHKEIRKGYLKNPYHNYEHAVDTLHAVYRVMSLTGITVWQGEVELFSLLLSALGHDLGHAGFTNPFLVETKHELALRYNDQSPLENMHCARLFEIASSTGCDVFEGLEPGNFKQARKTCVSAILHTDIAKHFDMVKSIAIIYELQSEICDAQAAKQHDILPLYMDQILVKHAGEWTNMILHFCDVSNCMKPFPLCQKWAIRVLEEFFNQGDEEARRGIPIGMLNNRDTVNLPGSQHGFIQFLVAPLALGAAKVFAPLLPLSEQMVSNMDAWKQIWIQESQPTEEEIGKRTAQIDKIRADCQALKDRERE
jgi:cAMP-specific phosphodiesterase 4